MTLVSNRKKFLEEALENLDIPDSHYEAACNRYRSIGRWLNREGSSLAIYGPEIYPQGSFLYGTVVPPLHHRAEYDLDLVCELAKLEKNQITQAELKRMVGAELKAYAEAHRMKEPISEGNRCWTLQYADGVSFHIDVLPCVPESGSVVAEIASVGISAELAAMAVAITDRRHPEYEQVTDDWSSGNPGGLGKWFVGRAQPHRLGWRKKALREEKAIAEVPSHQITTPLQRVIQVLKRHRDVYFLRSPKLAPISMIITALAGAVYQEERTVVEALVGVVTRLRGEVRQSIPRVPNPVNPFEDFADGWASDPRLEQQFWIWVAQLESDLELLTQSTGEPVRRRLKAALDIDLPDTVPVEPVVTPAPRVSISSSPPKPWTSR